MMIQFSEDSLQKLRKGIMMSEDGEHEIKQLLTKTNT